MKIITSCAFYVIISADECSSYGLPRITGQVVVQLPKKARDALKASDASPESNVQMSNSTKSVSLGENRPQVSLFTGPHVPAFVARRSDGLESL